MFSAEFIRTGDQGSSRGHMWGVVPGVNQWMGQPLWWNPDKGGRSIGGIDEISTIDDIERDF